MRKKERGEIQLLLFTTDVLGIDGVCVVPFGMEMRKKVSDDLIFSPRRESNTLE